jgi:flagellar protein FliL
MAEAVAASTDAKKPAKKGKLKLLIGLIIICALIGGGVGYSGMVAKLMGQKPPSTDASMSDVSKTAFVEMPRLMVPLGEQASAKHLAAQFIIETTREHSERVEKLKPRLLDMLNTYLRAVDEKELSEPSRFRQLQAQILRRAKLIAGDAAVRNVLIQEFILQ